MINNRSSLKSNAQLVDLDGKLLLETKILDKIYQKFKKWNILTCVLLSCCAILMLRTR